MHMKFNRKVVSRIFFLRDRPFSPTHLFLGARTPENSSLLVMVRTNSSAVSLDGMAYRLSSESVAIVLLFNHPQIRTRVEIFHYLRLVDSLQSFFRLLLPEI